MGKLSEKLKYVIYFIIAALAIILFVVIMLSVSSGSGSSSRGSSSSGSSGSGSSGSGSSGSGSSGSGSSGNNCIPPDPVTEGYDLSNVTGSSSKDRFSITGVRCASGYTGTASAIACSVAGQAYTLTGCSLTDSVVNNCDANEPTLTDSNMNAITADSCDGTAIGGTCVHTCNDGYTGGSVTCQADGTWAVAPCTQSADSGGGNEDSSSTNPCSLADVVPPTGGALGTRCADRSGSLAHGDSCNMTCNDGTDPTNQPLCTNGVLSSITATCSQVVPEPATTCSDNPCGTGATCTDNADGTGYTCTCDAGYWGTTTTNEAATCTEKTCANTDGAQPPTAASCGTGASCTEGGSGDGYTCTCDAGYTGTRVTNGPATCVQGVGGVESRYTRYEGRVCGVGGLHRLAETVNQSTVSAAAEACDNSDVCAGFSFRINSGVNSGDYTLLDNVAEDYVDGHPQLDCYEKIQ